MPAKASLPAAPEGAGDGVKNDSSLAYPLRCVKGELGLREAPVGRQRTKLRGIQGGARASRRFVSRSMLPLVKEGTNRGPQRQRSALPSLWWGQRRGGVTCGCVFHKQGGHGAGFVRVVHGLCHPGTGLRVLMRFEPSERAGKARV